MSDSDKVKKVIPFDLDSMPEVKGMNANFDNLEIINQEFTVEGDINKGYNFVKFEQLADGRMSLTLGDCGVAYGTYVFPVELLSHFFVQIMIQHNNVNLNEVMGLRLTWDEAVNKQIMDQCEWRKNQV